MKERSLTVAMLVTTLAVALLPCSFSRAEDTGSAPTIIGNAPGDRQENFSNRYGIEMVYIPPGKFMMGSNDTSSQKTVHTGMADHGYSPVQPVHQVTISYGFYMGKYEVTQAQWMRVMRTPNPSTFKCPNCPVDRVSFWDVANFLKKLNAMNDGYKYRLPSESEWEYACRAGTTGDYHDSDLDKIAWYSANSGKKTHPVGGKRPNAFGLYDMLGNAAEWCADYWHNDYVGAPADGSAWITGGDRGWRVFRGGGWSFNASDLRSATRYSEVPNYSSVGPGFRIVAIAQTK